MTESSPDRTVDQAKENRFKRWLLLEGNRLLVTGLLMAGFGILLAVLTVAGIVAYTDGDVISRMAGGMIAGTFSLVTIVLTINQLILSQELGHAGQIQDRMESTFSLREEVEEKARIPVSPADPIRFLQTIIRATQESAINLREQTAHIQDSAAKTHLDQLTDNIIHDTEYFEQLIADVEIHSLNEVIDILDYGQTFQIYQTRQTLSIHAETLPDEVLDELHELLQMQQQFITAKEYAKALHLQRELAQFSRRMLYIGLPAATTAFVVGLVYGDLLGATLSPNHLTVVVPVLLTVVFAPLALLASYIFRLATLIQRTASTGSFLAQEAGTADDILPERPGDP